MKNYLKFAVIISFVSGMCFSACFSGSSGDDKNSMVAAPEFSISTGSYSSDQIITITCATAGAEIHYTTGDSKPDSASPVYSSAISAAGNGTVMTIRAIAIKTGMQDSAEASVKITIDYNKVSTPQFMPGGGTYNTPQNITITCSTTGAVIRYTTDKTGPSATNGTVYTGPVSISVNSTLKAIAYKTGMADSTIASADYAFPAATPEFHTPSGTYSSDQNVTITCTTAGAEIHYTTNDTAPTSSSQVYNGAIAVAGHGTVMKIRAIAMKTGMQDSSEASVTITINYNSVSTPQFNPAGGTYKTAKSIAITCSTAGAQIRYTADDNVNLSATAGTPYTGPVTISVNCTLRAIAYKSGMADSIASADYRFTPVAPAITGITPGIHKLTAAWGAVTGAASYNLYYAKGTTVDMTSGTKIENISGTTKEIEFPKGGETYAFIVTAVNENGESLAGNVETAAPEKGFFWIAKGNTQFSDYSVEGVSLAIDSNNVPYVAYNSNGGNAAVMKFNDTNSTWEEVGTAGFTLLSASSTSLAIDSNDDPYIAFSDQGNGYKATVMKFNGTAWENVGTTGFSEGGTFINSLAFDSANTLYVAYMDWKYDYKATIMKFDGTSWVNVGSPGLSEGQGSYIKLAFDSGKTPYISFREWVSVNNARARVMKFNGTTWENVGNTVLSAGDVTSTSLAFDSNNNLYTAFGDNGNAKAGSATVMKFNSVTWENVGYAGFSTAQAYYVSLAFNSNNIPYVAFEDHAKNNKTTVMKFNGAAWENVGNAGFTPAIAEPVSFAIGSNDIPYVAYRDYSLEDGTPCLKATVMSYEYY